jgi:tRNA 2-selenouridine synthase
MPDQPTPEMFENLVAMELYRQNSQNKEVWLEDESQRLGTVNIPNGLWQVMLQSSVSFVHVPFEKRLEHIVSEYGTLPKDRLVNAITRI